MLCLLRMHLVSKHVCQGLKPKKSFSQHLHCVIYISFAFMPHIRLRDRVRHSLNVTPAAGEEREGSSQHFNNVQLTFL
jgi:hypothetical protein